MRLFLTLLLFSACSFASAMEWKSYPTDLPQFDYSGDKLKTHWDKLTMGTRHEWPDEAFIQAMSVTYPKLNEQMLELAKQPDAHPAVKALLENNITPLAEAAQQAWRFHYEGKYEQSYQLGMQLGAAGTVPAIYSKLMYATFMVNTSAEKLALFREIADEAEQSLQLTPGYDFGEFGLLYARVRILERLGTTASLATGFLGSTQKSLKELSQRHPTNSLYPTTFAGIQAGVVERVGSLIGRITYGATESRTLEGFQEALELQANLPVIYNEFIVALSRINPKKYKSTIEGLSAQCLALTPYSAEEALNQALCNTTYSKQDLVEN